jgi:hypothetical protein
VTYHREERKVPGCVLRAAGVRIDVDKFTESSVLSPCEIYRKGEPKGRRGRLHEKSGLNVVVSEASGDDLQQQIEDALKFLDRHGAEVERLLSHAEEASLDFGIWQRGEFAHYCHFPPELLRLVGSLGLGIEISVYAGAGN